MMNKQLTDGDASFHPDSEQIINNKWNKWSIFIMVDHSSLNFIVCEHYIHALYSDIFT